MVWTIENEEVIRVGDSTTHGGKVLTGSENTFYEDIPIARVGDRVSCPKCKGTHHIVSGAPEAFDDQKPIARNGDLVSCGAKLIARSAAANSQEERIPYAGPFDGQYDEQIIAIDATTGKPIHYYPFFIETEDGRTYMGRTDNGGKTPRISTQGKQLLTVYWGEEAVLKGAE